MQEKHKSVDDFAASNKTSSLCHKTIQPELTCETESHKTKMSLKLMKANTEAKLHHANLFSKLSLSHYSSHKEKCNSLSPQDNPSPKNNQQQQNLSTKFSEPVKCSNPLLESKTFLYKKCCACHIKSSLSLSSKRKS
jgi:hypothetical protein